MWNEEKYLEEALVKLLTARNVPNFNILIFDDGSTDNSAKIYSRFQQQHKSRIFIEKHETQLGYGRTIRDILNYGIEKHYDYLITFDADLQHEPSSISTILNHYSLANTDIVSGSRYLNYQCFPEDLSVVPRDRYLINMVITWLLNQTTNYTLTDAFCGIKGYNIHALQKYYPLAFELSGYSFPLEFWYWAFQRKLTVSEVPVPLIYRKGRRQREDWTIRLSNYIETLRDFAPNNKSIELIEHMEFGIFSAIYCWLERIHEWEIEPYQVVEQHLVMHLQKHNQFKLAQPPSYTNLKEAIPQELCE